MIVTFLRHGSNAWLALGLAALAAGFAARVLPFSIFWLVTGALTFYVSEYGFHRFGFHAQPSRFAFIRKLQHRLHYDHHAEPDRLDLLFSPVWFLVPNLALTALGYAIIFGWSVVASAMAGSCLPYSIMNGSTMSPIFPISRARGSENGSSNIICVITSSARSSGLACQILRWTLLAAPTKSRRSETQCNDSQALRLIA